MNKRILLQSSFFRIVAILFLTISLTNCEKEPDPVVVSSFEPTSGNYESEVTISGSHFAADAQNNIVKFGGTPAEILSGSATELIVTVPVGAVTGKITIEAGGQTVTTNENFTVTAGSWSRKADFGKAVDGHSLSFSIGEFAFIHKSQSTVNGSPVSASFWMYSTTTNTWVEKKELSLTQDSFMAYAWGTATNGYILQYNKLWAYTPATNTWALKNSLPVALITDNVRGVFYVNSVNKAYAIMQNGEWFSYDPINDVWGRIQDATFAASVAAATGDWHVQGANDKGFLMKGKSVWEFNPVNNQWSQLPAYPESSSDFTFGINNELYVGYAGDAYVNNFWVFKKDQNKWVRKAEVAGARYWPVYFSMNNKGYFGMGVKIPGDFFVYDFNEYTPQ